jgi:hypothetical protein
MKSPKGTMPTDQTRPLTTLQQETYDFVVGYNGSRSEGIRALAERNGRSVGAVQSALGQAERKLGAAPGARRAAGGPVALAESIAAGSSSELVKSLASESAARLKEIEAREAELRPELDALASERTRIQRALEAMAS